MELVKKTVLGLQMLFTAFGALVLVPLLTGMDSNIALFTAGVGTLIFQLCTKRSIPVFLGSSFAFIPAIVYGTKTWGLPSTLSGLAAAGIFYLILSFVIRIKGNDFLEKLLPPLITGPIIMLIGLILAPVAVNMAMGKAGDGSIQLVAANTSYLLAFVTLAATVIASIWGKGFFKLSSILIGLASGYILALILGVVNFDAVTNTSFISIPKFVLPVFNIEAILFILPIAIAPAIEHYGDISAISSVTGKDFAKNPGLHKSLMGDGLATLFAGLVGGPPNTTYSEVTGAVALTRAFDPKIMTFAAISAIILSFVSKLGAFLQTIPVPVMGGLFILLFGNIIVIGLSLLMKSKEDLHQPRNMAVLSIMLVTGIGGMTLSAGSLSLKGVGLASVLGLVLHLVLPKVKNV